MATLHRLHVIARKRSLISSLPERCGYERCALRRRGLACAAATVASRASLGVAARWGGMVPLRGGSGRR